MSVCEFEYWYYATDPGDEAPEPHGPYYCSDPEGHDGPHRVASTCGWPVHPEHLAPGVVNRYPHPAEEDQ